MIVPHPAMDYCTLQHRKLNTSHLLRVYCGKGIDWRNGRCRQPVLRGRIRCLGQWWWACLANAAPGFLADDTPVNITSLITR